MKNTPRKEIYVSTDIETNGPIPGPYSMLSFASVAMFPEVPDPVATFSANLDVLPAASEDPKTMEFWATCPEAYEATRNNTQDPAKAMLAYAKWLDSLPGAPVFVGYPAGFDFTFIYWYLMYFVGRSPFSFSGLDMKSYACAKLNIPFREATKRNFPHSWFGNKRHTHIALDDAQEQADLFRGMFLHP